MTCYTNLFKGKPLRGDLNISKDEDTVNKHQNLRHKPILSEFNLVDW